MPLDRRETAETMICEYGHRAGFLALVRSAHAWMRGDPEQRIYWRSVVGKIAELQTAAGAEHYSDNRYPQ